MKTEIYENYDAFFKREDKSINGVSPEFAQANPDWADERGNEGCWDCADCARCARCARCADCSGCFDCAEKIEADEYPKIVGIHQAVLQAAAGENALDMGDWHTCETTHCRAGWVVRLAGEAGEKLESKTSTLFAAMMIYKASSPIRVSPTQFFVTNEEAMEDMRRCAEEEIKLNAKSSNNA